MLLFKKNLKRNILLIFSITTAGTNNSIACKLGKNKHLMYISIYLYIWNCTQLSQVCQEKDSKRKPDKLIIKGFYLFITIKWWWSTESSFLPIGSQLIICSANPRSSIRYQSGCWFPISSVIVYVISIISLVCYSNCIRNIPADLF